MLPILMSVNVEVPVVALAVCSLVTTHGRGALCGAVHQRVVEAEVTSIALKAAQAVVNGAKTRPIAAVDAAAPGARVAQTLLHHSCPCHARGVARAQVEGLASQTVRALWTLVTGACGVQRVVALPAEAVIRAV